VRKDVGIVWANVSVSLPRDAAGEPGFAVGMLENVTERKLAEEALTRQAELNRHQALHDSLTGLPNRVLFHERIEQALRRAEREGEQIAVLLMDLDRFKEVNDALGHHAGDALLIEGGRRLPAVLRASDTVARLGGDEFGMLPLGPGGAEGVVPLVERIHRALEEPVVVSDLHYQPKAVLDGAAITSVEALVRWEHSERGLLAPDEFIGLGRAHRPHPPADALCDRRGAAPVPGLAGRGPPEDHRLVVEVVMPGDSLVAHAGSILSRSP
jgi:diguanylate cyclase (GGDEF)-like protein